MKYPEHGVFMEKAPSDWAVLQQEDGFAQVSFSGWWQVPQAAIDVGAGLAQPAIRVMREEDNSTVIPWTKTQRQPDADGRSGLWSCTLRVPAGGLYRVETGLDTIGLDPRYPGWMFRGDARFHLGVGDIFVIAGQSNAAGYAKDWAYDPPDPQVHLFRNRRRWDMAAHPLNETTGAAMGGNAEMGVPGASPWLSFAKRFAAHSRRPVGLIATAQGGTPLDRWDPDGKGDLYHNMVSRLQACGGRAAGVLWYQGCNDCNQEYAGSYSARFRQMVRALREELGYEIPFFTFQLNRFAGTKENDAYWGMVREAQRKAAREIPRVYVLPTLNSTLSDAIHNSAPGNVALGERMARLAAGALLGAQPFQAPDITAAFVKGKALTLTFSNVALGLESFGADPTSQGFFVRDAAGEIPVCGWKLSGSQICLTLEREPGADCTVSYGWEENPVHTPLADNVTYLPILSFYQFPVQAG